MARLGVHWCTAADVITTLQRPALLLLYHSNLSAHYQSTCSDRNTSGTLLFTMAGNNKYYYPQAQQPPSHHRSGSRRPPLTPSTVSSPCVSTHAPIASRRDSGSGSPTNASALLAKMASNPTTPRGETPRESPLPSPTTRAAEMASNPLYSPERPAVWRSESARYVRQYRQQGKHACHQRRVESL